MIAMKLQMMKCIVFITLVVVPGCSDDDSRSQAVTPPDRIQADGKTWTRQNEMSEKDNRDLQRLFKSNRSVSDNPDFRGEPSVFTCESGDRRYYWMSSLGSDVRSAYLQVDAKGRFQKIGETDIAPD